MTKMEFPAQAFTLSPALLSQMDLKDVLTTFGEMRDAAIADPPFPDFDILVPSYFLTGQLSAEGWMKRMEWGAKSLGDKWHWNMPAVTKALRHSHSIIRFQLREPREDGERNNAYYRCYYTVLPISDDDIIYPVALRQQPLGWSKFGALGVFKLLENGIVNGQAECDVLAHQAVHRIYPLLIVALASRGLEKITKANKLSKLKIGNACKRPHLYTTHIGFPNESADSTGTNGITIRPHFRRGHVRHQHFGVGNAFEKVVFIQPVWVNMELGQPDKRDHYNVNRPANSQ